MKETRKKVKIGREQHAALLWKKAGNDSEYRSGHSLQLGNCFSVLPIRTFNPTQEQVNFLVAVYSNVADRLTKRIHHLQPGQPDRNFKELLEYSLERIDQLEANATAAVSEFTIGEIELFGRMAECYVIDCPTPPYIEMVNEANYAVLLGIMESGETDADGHPQGLRYWHPYNMHNFERLLLDFWFDNSYTAYNVTRHPDEYAEDIFYYSYVDALNGDMEETEKFISELRKKRKLRKSTKKHKNIRLKKG